MPIYRFKSRAECTTGNWTPSATMLAEVSGYAAAVDVRTDTYWGPSGADFGPGLMVAGTGIDPAAIVAAEFVLVGHKRYEPDGADGTFDPTTLYVLKSLVVGASNVLYNVPRWTGAVGVGFVGTLTLPSSGVTPYTPDPSLVSPLGFYGVVGSLVQGTAGAGGADATLLVPTRTDEWRENRKVERNGVVGTEHIHYYTSVVQKTLEEMATAPAAAMPQAPVGKSPTVDAVVEGTQKGTQVQEIAVVGFEPDKWED